MHDIMEQKYSSSQYTLSYPKETKGENDLILHRPCHRYSNESEAQRIIERNSNRSSTSQFYRFLCVL